MHHLAYIANQTITMLTSLVIRLTMLVILLTRCDILLTTIDHHLLLTVAVP
jgi:hypothetical protein